MEQRVNPETENQMVPLNEIKVVFLGDGEAGKSYTIARLMNDGGDPVDYTDRSTPGIVIRNKEYDLDGRKIQVHYWDFGGQEIMHSMHRIFLTNRTMYVVLLNARDNTQGDRAQYWLQNIQSFAPDAPVLLVLNKIDQNSKAAVDERTLSARYKGLTQVVRMSALRFDQEQFNREFTDVLLSEIRKCDFLDAQWPRSWFEVKNRLATMDQHYISGNMYKQICRKYGVENMQTELLRWFNDLGVSLCFCDEEDYTLKNHVILRPDWITNALYIILFNECEGTQNGLVRHRSIYELLDRAHMDRSIRCTLPDAAYNRPGDVEYVLGVMRKFQLSLDTGNGKEFIPMLCQTGSTSDIQYYEQDSDTLEFHMEFEYLPNNLLHRLMVERYAELDMANVWRTGARFCMPEVGLSAVVVIDNDVLKFFIRHASSRYRPNTYLTILKEHVEQICKKMGLRKPTPLIVYKLDGKRELFDYENLKFSREVGQTTTFSMAHRRMIPIEDILNQAGPDTNKAKQLVENITRACAAMQERQMLPDEDWKNRFLKDWLQNFGYIISDPFLLGATSISGRRGAEPDLFLLDEQKNPLTVIEAMNVRGTSSSIRYWDEHLTKLLHHYNTRDLSPLFLICYVQCEKDGYAKLWNRYREHMRRYAPDRSELVYESYTELECKYNCLRIAYCRYIVNGKEITVYHYFVRVETAEAEVMPPLPYKPVEETEKPWFPEPAPPEPQFEEKQEPLAGLQEAEESASLVPPYLEEEPEQSENPQETEQPDVQESEPPQQAGPVLWDYRVVFLGDSEAGKTLIQARLNEPDKDPKDFRIDTTIGINIVRKTETINRQLVRVNYWDFGGQEILHSMHRIFLAKNTLYVIVLNTRNDNQDAQAVFWLRYVEAYAPGSPVLLVMNKIDQNKRAALNLPILKRLFSNRKFEADDVLKISAMWREEEHDRFQEQFTKKLHKCIGRHLNEYQPYTSEVARVLDRIEKMKNADRESDKLKTISIDAFRSVCEKENIHEETNQDALMKRFNETGILVYFKGKTTMFMNPEWITGNLYRILDEGEKIAENGIVPHRKIKSFCRRKIDNENGSRLAEDLLKIMEDYDLAFQYEQGCPGKENSEDKEFIPMLCQREEPEKIDELISEENTVELRMVFEYLPCGVLYKMMVDYREELDMDNVWLTGMKLDRNNGSSYAVVRQEGNAMGIFVHDNSISNAVEWLWDLRAKIAYEAKYGKSTAVLLETKLGYKISDIKEYFDYQQLKNAEKKGVYYTVSHSETAPQKVAIRDILSQKDGTVLDKIDELLKYTSKGCQKLQGQHTYWFLAPDVKDDRRVPKMDEDGRTQMLETVLEDHFLVQPQKRWGDSSGGIKQGELDLWIGIDQDTPLALLEALNITSYGEENPNASRDNSSSVTRWKEHLTRVMGDYNKNSFKNILLVSYLDCPAERLAATREEYFKRLKNFDVPNYGVPKYCETVVVDEFVDGIQVVRADYSGGAGDVTVFHFLVRIEQYGRKAREKAEKEAHKKKRSKKAKK